MARRLGNHARPETAWPHAWHALRCAAERAILVLAGIVMLAGGFVSNSVFAQLPATQLHALFPAGGRVGTVVDVQIAAGADLEAVNRLQFSHAGISAVQKTTEPGPFQSRPQPLAGLFLVTIASDVPPGTYEARAVGRFGISNPRAFVVGELPEIREAEDNNTPDKASAVPLGAVVNGTAEVKGFDYFKIALKKDQKTVLDCWAERIDSRMDATLVVLDFAGRELARDRDSHRHDPMIVFTPPADGDYIVKVYDFLYRGGSKYFYRLSVGVGPHIDFIFPPAGLPGSKGHYTIYGSNLPGGAPAKGISIGGRELEQLAVEIEFPSGDAAQQSSIGALVRPEEWPLDGFAYRLRTPQGSSNPYFLGFAAAPVFVETEPNDDAAKPQSVSVPCEFAGRFDRRGDDDWIAFDAHKEDVFWLDVISQRLGLATDPYLLLQRVTKNAQGEAKSSDIQERDDAPNNIDGVLYKSASGDPNFRFQVPNDGHYRILVRNLDPGARDDPRQVYRLSIRRPAPDFRLAAVPVFHSNNRAASAPVSPLVRRGGTEMIDVLALRRDGFAGEIELSVLGLPPGVTAAPATIGPHQDSTTLVLSAAEDAPAGQAMLQIIGQARLGQQTVLRAARPATVVWASPDNQIAPVRMCRDLALAVTAAETLPFRVEVGDQRTWETSRAGTLEIPVKVIRRGDFQQPITLAPQGLQPHVTAQPLTIDADASEGTLMIEVARNATLGRFNFHLQAQTTLSYRRDPQSADEAAAVKREIEKIAADLAAAAAAAEQAARDAQSTADAAAEAQPEADQNSTETAEKFKAAADETTIKEQAAAEAAAQAKAAAEAKAAADKRADDLAKAAEPNDVKVFESSLPVTIQIAGAPLEMVLMPPSAPLKAGAQIEVPVTLERKYGFVDAVDIELLPPATAKGVTAARLALSADQGRGRLTIVASTDAAVGAHTLVVRAKLTFNGQDLQVQQTVPLVVEPPPQPLAK